MVSLLGSWPCSARMLSLIVAERQDGETNQPNRLMQTILRVSYEFGSGNFADVVIVKNMLAE